MDSGVRGDYKKLTFPVFFARLQPPFINFYFLCLVFFIFFFNIRSVIHHVSKFYTVIMPKPILDGTVYQGRLLEFYDYIYLHPGLNRVDIQLIVYKFLLLFFCAKFFSIHFF